MSPLKVHRLASRMTSLNGGYDGNCEEGRHGIEDRFKESCEDPAPQREDRSRRGCKAVWAPR